MNFDEALSYLLSLGHEMLTIKLGLTNTEILLEALGNPQRDFAAVQIAGTNGKGSTAVMLESICRAAGIRIGLFTSPHLISITERITIDGAPIAESEFANLTSLVKATAATLVGDGRMPTPPTFFEHVTAIALLAFRKAGIELAILETGLGGRLDSTTAAAADIVAITPIAMDHEEYLGSTLTEIAAEKAAIIRPGVGTVVAPQSPRALEAIEARLKDTGVSASLVERDSIDIHSTTADGRCLVTIRSGADVYEQVRLNLRGRHQVVNAAVVIGLAESLRERGFPISHDSVVQGLETAEHAGRLEFWEGPPRILFDGAHNPESARALQRYLDEFVPEPITMIFAATKDKQVAEMAATLFPEADEIILTSLDNPRALNPETVLTMPRAVADRERIRVTSSPREALTMAQKSGPGKRLICVTGSLYLVGEIRKILAG
jgi:dihydrofolate synthase / folylpolyglutamate synthase